MRMIRTFTPTGSTKGRYHLPSPTRRKPGNRRNATKIEVRVASGKRPKTIRKILKPQ